MDDSIRREGTVKDVNPSFATVSLRAGHDDDLAALLDLAVAFYDEDNFTTMRDELYRNLEHLLRSNEARVVVCESAAGLCAFAVTTSSFGLENGLIAELEDLYVAPDHRRQGLAERLIEDAADWARRRGASHLEVVTAPNGHDVGHLKDYYEARGFVDEGREIRARPLRQAPR